MEPKFVVETSGEGMTIKAHQANLGSLVVAVAGSVRDFFRFPQPTADPILGAVRSANKAVDLEVAGEFLLRVVEFWSQDPASCPLSREDRQVITQSLDQLEEWEQGRRHPRNIDFRAFNETFAGLVSA